MIKTWRTLQPAERKALLLIRTAANASTGIDPDTSPWIASLARIVALLVAEGRPILAPASSYVSAEEHVLLNMLALCQRRAVRPTAFAEERIGRALEDAADHLLALGIKLSITGGVTKIGARRSDIPAGTHNCDAKANHRELFPANSTLRSIVERTLRKRGLLDRHEIERLGVSRQYLAHLVRRGAIVRAGTGCYALPRRNSEDRVLPI